MNAEAVSDASMTEAVNEYPLAVVFPWVRRFKLPVTRDQVMLLMLATNELFLGVDTYLAHRISGTIVPREWWPILFGPVAGVLLLAAGLLAVKRRMLANIIATVVFLGSIFVGVLGSYFHWIRAILPDAAIGQQVSLPLLVWAPPLLGPIMFALVGILGMSAAWQEDVTGSGRLVLPNGGRLALPYSKMQAYFLAVGIGTVFTLVSSVLDHARTGFENPWLWLPTVIGVAATVVAVAIGFLDDHHRGDLGVYTGVMLVMILVGVIGFVLHALSNLVGDNVVVFERYIRGAPLMAPLLFANMGMIGLIVLLKPEK